jgi:hypothetical protein
MRVFAAVDIPHRALNVDVPERIESFGCARNSRAFSPCLLEKTV